MIKRFFGFKIVFLKRWKFIQLFHRFQIVEHLIPLCELLDLGFDETKISDALIRFDNNKDKALDYLIS